MEFSTGYFGTTNKFEVENKSKGIEIKVIKGSYHRASDIVDEILIYETPPYFKGNIKELGKRFEQDIEDLKHEIEKRKMLIQLTKRRNAKIVD